MTIPHDPNSPQSPIPPTPGNPPTLGAKPTSPIEITTDDINSVENQERVAEMERGKQVALVREVGAASEAKGGGTLQAILILTGGGAVGGLIAFLVNRLLFNVLELFEGNSFATNLTFTFVLAFFIGMAVALSDVIASRNWSKLGVVAAIAIPAAIVASLVLGLFAHLFYSSGTEWILENAFEEGTRQGWSDEEFLSYVQLWLHPVRGIAWMLVGVAAGVAAGAGSRSIKRVGIAAAGGAIGGFLGGFIFDFLPGEIAAQVIGIVLLGTLIGLATGLVEQAAKSRWIEIVSGGLAGKQFILYKKQINLGSSPQADITIIKDPSIPDLAAMIDSGAGQARIVAANPMIPVVVNGTAQVSCPISDGDIITLGSSQLRFREKSSDSKVPGALRY